MDEWNFWLCAAGAATLAMIAALVEHCRARTWRRVAERRWLFIEDCKQAMPPPDGICFGPTFLRIVERDRRRLIRHEESAIALLSATEARRDWHAARAEAAIGQAKRLERIRRDQQKTIRELSALLAGDTERICDEPVAVEVDRLRRIALAMAWNKRGSISRLCFHAAAFLEAMLLRMPEPSGEAKTAEEPAGEPAVAVSRGGPT